jgi:hypothetical protein
MSARENDDDLIRRLRRIVAAAGSMTRNDDRRRVLVLHSELKAVRAAIAGKSERLIAEMNCTRAHIGAATAYARCAALAYPNAAPAIASQPTTANTART